MLKIQTEPQWTHDVAISVPVDGGFETQTCKVRFRLLDEDTLDPDDRQNPMSILRGTVVHMADLADEKGNPLDWNDALRDRLFKVPFIQKALIAGYYRSVVGAREGNLAGSGALGPRAN